jgi:GT2 family glycosyltransferase
VSLLITIPVFGQHEYTHALVGDLEREGAEYLIVDNRGDYPKISNERVTTPDENLGWARGSDLGFRIAFSEGYSHAMTLNNDTRISKGFVAALLDPRLPLDAGIVGPMIDHGFPYAVADVKADAADYTPRPLYRAVPAVGNGADAVLRILAGCRRNGPAHLWAIRVGSRSRSGATCPKGWIRPLHNRDGLYQALRTQDR